MMWMMGIIRLSANGRSRRHDVHEDKSPVPVDIRTFCADGIMFSTDHLAYLVEKVGGGSAHFVLFWDLQLW